MNWTTILTLTALAVPGVAVATPSLVGSLMRRAGTLAPEKPLPPRSVLVAASMAQTLLLVAGAAALGGVFAPRVGLGELVAPALGTPAGLGRALLLAALGSAAMLGAYYGLFRRWLDPQTLQVSEGLRRDLGLWARVLYGGVVEEVLMRWGLMPLLIWAFAQVTGDSAAFWAGNLLTGLLFSALHWPAYLGAGCRPTHAFFTTSLVLNTGLALLYGALMREFGLAGAILGHVVTHLMWYPLDLRHWRAPRPA